MVSMIGWFGATYENGPLLNFYAYFVGSIAIIVVGFNLIGWIFLNDFEAKLRSLWFSFIGAAVLNSTVGPSSSTLATFLSPQLGKRGNE